MSRSLEDKWIEKYHESIELLDRTAEVFTGFNLNMDVIHRIEEIPDAEPELKHEVKSREELNSALRYCMENGENHEIDYSKLEMEEGGKRQIGGQGGIIANYLAKTENEVILYTPSLSDKIAGLLDERILYPVSDDDLFYLKSIEDVSNSEKTKENHIFEFKTDKTCRLILSGRLPGYGPYLPDNIEEELPLIESNVRCCILSGFHNVTGNKTAKLKRSAKQLKKIDKPIHIEFVHKDVETSRQITRHIIPEADSLGIDQVELEKICSILGIQAKEEPNFGEAFQMLKKILEELELKRVHLHTFRFHITVTSSDYSIDKTEIRKSMLFGEISAIQLAEKGEIPDREDIENFEIEDKNIQETEQLKNFGDFHDLEGFADTGVTEIEGLKVIGIPIINHPDPERTVGMGDIISAGAFSMENSID